MKIVCTYIADDGEEFETESECREYEASLARANGGVAAFDKDLNYIPVPTPKDWEVKVWFMKILDGEQADALMRWVDDYCGICMDGLPDHMTTGEVWAWNERHGGAWYKPLEQYAELKRIADAIEKAVNSVG